DLTAPRWILQTFTEVSFSELAGAFQMAEPELIEAAAKDESLLLALALIATSERRLDLLEIVAANLPSAWERMFAAGLDTLGSRTESERQRWQEILVHPYRKDPPANYLPWDWLHRITDAEAPASVMSIVLQAGLLASAFEHEYGGEQWIELFAAMCPAS